MESAYKHQTILERSNEDEGTEQNPDLFQLFSEESNKPKHFINSNEGIDLEAQNSNNAEQDQLDTNLESENFEQQISDSALEYKVERRFCSPCGFDQPYRSKHCKYCNRCVASYDHHCPWIGKY